jgi:xylose isomerase
VDALARALLTAAELIGKGALKSHKEARYAGWQDPLGQAMMAETASLDSIADQVVEQGLNPDHASGRQEYLENLVNRSLV